MKDPAAWLGLGALIALVLSIPLTRSISRAVRKKQAARAREWASRFYTDPTSRDVAARFVLILESQINVPLARFTPQTSFLDDLGMDELEPVEVLMAIEEEFKISQVPARDAQKMEVIDDVVRYLTAR